MSTCSRRAQFGCSEAMPVIELDDGGMRGSQQHRQPPSRESFLFTPVSRYIVQSN